MKTIKHLFLFAILFVINLSAQTEDKSLLTIDRIFNSMEFMGGRFRQVRFIEDGKYYTTVETSKDTPGGKDIVKYETESGNREVMVSTKLLIPEGESKPLQISDYIWSSDKSKLMIFTNTERVWRYNTRGDYYVLDLTTSKLQKLGGSAKPSSLMFTKFSPDDKKVAYVSEHNIYCEDLVTGKITQLTFDGSKTIINGTFDWVYEEELDCRDGFRWSSDGKSIAYWQLDASGVNDFFMINDTDSLYSKVIPVQYPKAGTTNSSCKVGVVNAEGGETVWMNVQGDPRNNYIARMEWAENSDEIIFQHLNREQNKLDIILGNAKTGDVKTVISETDKAWIDVGDDFRWIDGGKSFLWTSERDGWRHIYLVTRDGGNVKKITSFDFDVISIESVDEKGGWIYFMASPNNATQKYLYRVELNGSRKYEQISPAEHEGTHRYQIADGAGYAIHTYSNINCPPVTNLIKLPSHEVIRNLVDNKDLIENVSAIKKLPTEFFKVDIGDGVILDGWMIKPYNFDESKKYPVLFLVYGEPASQTVLDSWGGPQTMWHEMLAQQGYIIISVDNRGTPAPRGREWRKSIYKKIGILNSSDQAKAAEALIKQYNFIDPERIAVWGWSGGGSMTLNLLFRYPKIFKTGMSVAPVSNEKFYDTIYQERYMGLLPENDSIYVQGSAVTFANQLEGNLLIVHGTGDDNVHYQNSEVVINELIKNNKHFTMMAYPNRTHGIYEGENTTLHLFTLLTKYLNDNLKAGGI
jgi:dipeptidyl-peptidase 4